MADSVKIIIVRLVESERSEVARLKFQKRSALKFSSRAIPGSKSRGTRNVSGTSESHILEAYNLKVTIGVLKYVGRTIPASGGYRRYPWYPRSETERDSDYLLKLSPKRNTIHHSPFTIPATSHQSLFFPSAFSLIPFSLF